MKKFSKLMALVIALAVVMSTVVMPVSADTAVENLYAIGSFESFTASDELAPYVGNYGAADRKYTLMTDGNGANGTSNYVRMSDSTWTQGFFQTMLVENLKPGKTYRATVYLKSESGTMGGVRLRLKQSGDAVVATGSTLSISDSDWTKATIDYTIPADDAKKNLIIQLYVDTARTPIYVDEVSLVEYVAPVTNVVGDGTFESLTADTYGTLMNAGATDPTITFVDNADNKCVLVGAGSYASASANTAWLSGVLETGVTYVATAYVKLQNSGTANTMFVKYRDTSGSTLTQGATVSGVTADAWKPVTVQFTATSPNMQLQFFCYDKLPYYLDNITVKRVVSNNPSWGTFEYVGELGEITNQSMGSGATAVLMTDGQGAFDSQNYIKITGRSGIGSNISTPAYTVEEGKTYKASYYVKTDADTNVIPRVNYTGNGAVFTAPAVAVKAGQWTKCEVEFTATADFAGKWGQSIGMSAYEEKKLDLYYDSFSVEEITKPALTMTEDFETNEAVAIDAPVVINVGFSTDARNFSGKNDPSNSGVSSDQGWSNLAASNFSVDNGATLNVNVANNKQATLTVSGLAYGTTYTVKATGLTDYYGNTITDATIATFTTEEEPVVVLPDNLAEGKNVKGAACTVTANDDGSYTVSNQTWGGGYKAYVDGITGEAGKKYVASVLVKSASGTAVNDSASIVGGVLSSDQTKISVASKCNTETITGEWTRVSAIIEVNSLDGTSTSGSINIGVRGGTTANAELYMLKDVELREISDTLDIDTSWLIKKVANEDGTTTVYLHSPSNSGQTIYIFAANYADDGVTFEGAQLVKDWFNANGCGSFNVPQADKYFIWDSQFRPLNTALTSFE